jgi:hypothetical protein
MRRVCTILLAAAALLQAMCSSAADFYTVLTVSVTNQVNGIATNGTDTLTVIGDTRTATNNIASNPSKLWLGTNAQLRATTNLYNHIALYAFGAASSRLQLQWLNTNQFRLIGQVNQAVAGSAGGVWGTVVSTNYPVTNRTAMFSPADSASLITQTNFGNAIVAYLNVAASFLSQTAAGLSNYMSLHQPQTASNKTFRASAWQGGAITGATNLTATNVNFTTGVLYSVTITAGSYAGLITALTNGWLYSNTLFYAGLDHASLSNATFYGSNSFLGASIALTGSGVNNFLSMTATSTIAAVGPNQIFSRERGIATAVNANDVLGNIVFSGYGTTGQTAGGRIRIFAEETFTDSSGASSMRFETTPTGGSATIVRLRIQPDGSVIISNSVTIYGTNYTSAQVTTNLTALSGSISNTLFTTLAGTNFQARDATLTGSNKINGDLSFDRFINSTMINGNNSGILIGTNVIVELSGATTIAQYAGFTASRDGDFRLVRASGAVTNILVDANDIVWSPDGTAARRMVTGTGGAIVMTNNPSWWKMLYRGASSRWEIMDHSN